MSWGVTFCHWAAFESYTDAVRGVVGGRLGGVRRAVDDLAKDGVDLDMVVMFIVLLAP